MSLLDFLVDFASSKMANVSRKLNRVSVSRFDPKDIACGESAIIAVANNAQGTDIAMLASMNTRRTVIDPSTACRWSVRI